MKLATKIASGFAALLIIALALGALAAVAMSQASTRASGLRDQQAPAVGIANAVERQSLLTMYNVRSWALTENPDWKKAAEEHFARVITALDAADKLATDQDMTALGDASKDARNAATEYYGYYTQTGTQLKVMNDALAKRVAAAGAFLKPCEAYLADQRTALTAEIEAEAGKDKLNERVAKINGMTEIIALGTGLRTAALRAQAETNATLFTTRLGDFDKITAKADELLPITRQPGDQESLAQLKKAAAEFRTAAEAWLEADKSVEELGKKRAAAAGKVLEAAQKIAEANLTATVTAAKDSATGLTGATRFLLIGLAIASVVGIALAFGITLSITRPVNRIVDQLSAGADQTASAASQVSQSSQSMASGASQQAASLEETGASLEEMTAMVRSAADNAGKTDGITNKAKGDFERGLKAMTDLSTAMKEIKDSADKTAKIVKTIDEIAFQTNLLALNAAVEAARAGDAGKGFAVVAEEVRNLAQRAGEAARNTAALIEGSVKSAETGVVLCRNTGEIMTELAAGTRTIAELVGQIATGSKEQSQGIDQINKAVVQMDQITQSSAANAEEGAATAEELSAQAEGIRGLVNELEVLVRGAAAQQQRAQFHAPAATARTLTPAKTTMGQRTTNTAHGAGDASNLGRF